MVIILDQNTRAESVKLLQTDDSNTGIPAGSYIVSPEILEKLIEFLNSKTQKVA